MTTHTLADRLAETLPDFWCGACDGECTAHDEDGCCMRCGACIVDTRVRLRPAVLALVEREVERERLDVIAAIALEIQRVNQPELHAVVIEAMKRLGRIRARGEKPND